MCRVTRGRSKPNPSCQVSFYSPIVVSQLPVGKDKSVVLLVLGTYASLDKLKPRPKNSEAARWVRQPRNYIASVVGLFSFWKARVSLDFANLGSVPHGVTGKVQQPLISIELLEDGM